MSILIRGMKMPAEPMVLILFPNGNISTEDYETGANAKAIELPQHGRLIDADVTNKILSLLKDLTSTEDYMGIGYNHGVVDSMITIKNTPTIIEAEDVDDADI